MSWTSEKIFINTAKFFAAMLDEVEKAESCVEMEYYIIQENHIADKLEKIAVDLVKRGIAVRILVDGFGSSPWIFKRARSLVRQGVGVRVYHPFPLLLLPPFLRTFLLALNWMPYLLRMNQRNHRKMCIIDRKTAYVGSQNVFCPFDEDGESTVRWRECGARLEGEEIAILATAHERAWNRAWKFEIPFPFPNKFRGPRASQDSPLVRLNDTLGKRRRLWHDLLNRIATAKQRVWITSAYFVPAGSLLTALRTAANNGVDVRILMPEKSDITFLPWISAALSFSLLQAGVKIYQYQKYVLHAKTMIIDDWPIVGSSNLNHRSLLHDLELDVVLTKPESLQILVEAFETDLQQSSQLTMEDWLSKPWYTRLIGRSALLFKRYL